MKKLILAFFAAVTFFISNNAIAAETAEMYMVDDQQVEQLIAQSEDMSMMVAQADLMQTTEAASSLAQPAKVKTSDQKFVPALLLNLFLGGLGIHRLYLGTKPLTWIGYILTCGGIFGIVPLVDIIVIIINNENLSQFVDNPKFFMWAK